LGYPPGVFACYTEGVLIGKPPHAEYKIENQYFFKMTGVCKTQKMWMIFYGKICFLESLEETLSDDFCIFVWTGAGIDVHNCMMLRDVQGNQDDHGYKHIPICGTQVGKAASCVTRDAKPPTFC